MNSEFQSLKVVKCQDRSRITWKGQRVCPFLGRIDEEKTGIHLRERKRRKNRHEVSADDPRDCSADDPRGVCPEAHPDVFRENYPEECPER